MIDPSGIFSRIKSLKSDFSMIESEYKFTLEESKSDDIGEADREIFQPFIEAAEDVLHLGRAVIDDLEALEHKLSEILDKRWGAQDVMYERVDPQKFVPGDLLHLGRWRKPDDLEKREVNEMKRNGDYAMNDPNY